MSIVTRNLTIAAGASLEIARQADFLRCLASSATVTVQFDNGDGGDLEGGLGYAPDGGFQFIRIKNPTADPVTLKIAIGKGAMSDSRSTVNTGQVLPVRQGAPDVFSAGAPVAAADGEVTPLSDADPKRREVLIVNTDPAATIYIGGDAGAAAGAGVPVGAGQSLTLETAAAVYARNDSGAAVSVAVATMGWAS